jgi:hypothetical protein
MNEAQKMTDDREGEAPAEPKAPPTVSVRQEPRPPKTDLTDVHAKQNFSRKLLQAEFVTGTLRHLKMREFF